MTSDLIKRLREETEHLGRVNGGPHGVFAEEIALLLEAATALERGVWKPDLEAAARIIDPIAFEQKKRWGTRPSYHVSQRIIDGVQHDVETALAKARDILALPSLVEGHSDEQT